MESVKTDTHSMALCSLEKIKLNLLFIHKAKFVRWMKGMTKIATDAKQ